MLWVDALLALAAFGLCLTVLAGPVDGRPGGGGWLLVAVHSGSLIFRRVSPRAAFAVGLGAAAVYLASGEPMVGLTLAPIVLLYSLAAAVPRRAAVSGLMAAEVVLIGDFLHRQATDVSTLVGNGLVMGVAWLIGDATFRRRQEAVTAVAMAAERAAIDERLRIAREMHDIVAHSMSIMVVQAGSGRMAIDDDPGAARRALTVIENTGRDALAEMRHLLGVLRIDETASTAPLPSLQQLDQLVGDASRAGTPVEVTVTGDRRALPPGVEATAYRAVQEALTNVRRHAPGTAVRLRLSYDLGGLDLEIVNDPPVHGSSSTDGAGRGLMFMRERIEASGGVLDAGPTDDGGFCLRARFPEQALA